MKIPTLLLVLSLLSLVACQAPTSGRTTSAGEYLNSSGRKLVKGDYDGAIADSTRAIEIYPKYAWAYYNRGSAKKLKGDYDGAIADFTRAIELDPKGTILNVFSDRGSAKKLKGDYDGAIADFTRAIEVDSKDANAHNGLASAHYRLRNWTGALSEYRKFCDLSKRGQSFPRFQIFLIRSRLDESGPARQELAAYLEKRWDGAPGDGVQKIGDFLLDKITESDFFATAASPNAKTDSGRRCGAWYYAGMKHLLKGDEATAVSYFQKCLATEEKTLHSYYFAESELKALGK